MSKIPSVKRKLFRAVAERDQWTCHLCGAAVLPGATGGGEPTLDHVVPRSAGGLRVFDNLRLAHHGCNHERGNRAL